MSIAVVVELSRELRRLAVAGVGLAGDDHRLASLLPELERIGDEVPVFARIAERTAELIGAPKSAAPGCFSRLNALVDAVLRAQCGEGVEGVEGDLVPTPTTATIARRIPSRFLEALDNGRRTGRSDTLRTAIDRGWYTDVRVVGFVLEAVHSRNAELAELAATRLVPHYGQGIVPRLVASLELSSKGPAARVIEAVRHVDGRAGAALARQILDPEAEPAFEIAVEGVTVSAEAIVAAIGCLGDEMADRPLLRARLGARKKAIRVAALSRLLLVGDDEARTYVATTLAGSTARVREVLETIEGTPNPARYVRD